MLDAIDVFARSQTQWRMSLIGPTGLDYGGVAVVARALDIDLTDTVLRGIQTLEIDALGGGVPEKKPCSGPACAMCTKHCADRMP